MLALEMRLGVEWMRDEGTNVGELENGGMEPVFGVAVYASGCCVGDAVVVDVWICEILAT